MTVPTATVIANRVGLGKMTVGLLFAVLKAAVNPIANGFSTRPSVEETSFEGGDAFLGEAEIGAGSF
ncbi:hypothetical protein [Streptomyces sp. B29(2018)]|uniref:hypothetical protein n=1 Tax=Streptomyces sp. B29(2018) TaxID=2485016 RepID=UPI000FD69E87|nr:hypothetical protein [Streptomyces sp. B29(2018)]